MKKSKELKTVWEIEEEISCADPKTSAILCRELIRRKAHLFEDEK